MLATAPSLLVVALLAGAAVAGGIAVYAWRRTATPARLPFVGLTATDAVWLSLYALALSAPPTTVRVALEGLYLAAGGLVGVWWVLFGLAYAGRTEYVSARTGAVLSLPSLALVAAIAVDPTVSVLWSADVAVSGGVTVMTRGATTPAFGAVVVYLYATISAGYLLVLRQVSAERSLYTAQTAWIVGASVPATVAGVIDVTRPGLTQGIHLVPFTVPLVLVGFAVALFRYDMAEITPGTGRVGREAALRDLGDPVVITDGDGRVADLNPAAADTFGVQRADAVGGSLPSVVGASDDASLDDGATRTLRTVDGARRFEVSASDVEPSGDRSIGRALVFRDVTRRQLREQRLQVFNRVVRHNLRNDMNVVAGHAELLETGTDSGDAAETRTHARTIRTIAEQLVDLGQKAHAFEQAVTAGPETNQVAVADVVDSVLRSLDQDHDAEVAVDVPPDLSVTTDGAVLEMVLHNAVENALEHAGAEPSVRVTARREGDHLRLTVEDDGPGLPEQERSVLSAGEESPLEHGSGLGLWIVAWGTEWLGGDVGLDCDDGTTVTVRVPDTDSADRPVPTVSGLRSGDGVAGDPTRGDSTGSASDAADPAEAPPGAPDD